MRGQTCVLGVEHVCAHKDLWQQLSSCAGCVQAVRGAVVKRLEWLDSNFLAALNAFLSLPGVRSNPDLTALLGAVRTETLQLVSGLAAGCSANCLGGCFVACSRRG